jgi:hypothetical protein
LGKLSVGNDIGNQQIPTLPKAFVWAFVLGSKDGQFSAGAVKNAVPIDHNNRLELLQCIDQDLGEKRLKKTAAKCSHQLVCGVRHDLLQTREIGLLTEFDQVEHSIDDDGSDTEDDQMVCHPMMDLFWIVALNNVAGSLRFFLSGLVNIDGKIMAQPLRDCPLGNVLVRSPNQMSTHCLDITALASLANAGGLGLLLVPAGPKSVDFQNASLLGGYDHISASSCWSRRGRYDKGG